MHRVQPVQVGEVALDEDRLGHVLPGDLDHYRRDVHADHLAAGIDELPRGRNTGAAPDIDDQRATVLRGQPLMTQSVAATWPGLLLKTSS